MCDEKGGDGEEYIHNPDREDCSSGGRQSEAVWMEGRFGTGTGNRGGSCQRCCGVILRTPRQGRQETRTVAVFAWPALEGRERCETMAGKAG